MIEFRFVEVVISKSWKCVKKKKMGGKLERNGMNGSMGRRKVRRATDDGRRAGREARTGLCSFLNQGRNTESGRQGGNLRREERFEGLRSLGLTKLVHQLRGSTATLVDENPRNTEYRT